MTGSDGCRSTLQRWWSGIQEQDPGEPVRAGSPKVMTCLWHAFGCLSEKKVVL